MEASLPLAEMPALLDLEQIAAERRAAMWCGRTPSIFPGLSVSRIVDAPHIGNIRHVPLGSGSIWAITSAPAVVRFQPKRGPAADSSFSMILQVTGALGVRQEGRACVLDAGDLCFVDETMPFELEGEDVSNFLVLRLSRVSVLDRNPHLREDFACRVDHDQPAAIMLGDTLFQAARTALLLGDWQRQRIAAALVQLLGIAIPRRDRERHWRVEAALARIEKHLRESELGAEDIARAQGISRRRLDQLMKSATGKPISAHIWDRRLEQAAADLTNGNHDGRTVAAIGYANGFADAAHFSRAFKHRYGKSPLAWRRGAEDGSAGTH